MYALRQFVVWNGSKKCEYVDGSFKTSQGLTSMSHGQCTADFVLKCRTGTNQYSGTVFLDY